jgi:mono/diheme cytochrome c family protein
MKMLSTTSLSLLIAATLLPAAVAVAAETTPREGFDAAALFKASCAPCHGLAGAGDASVLASEVPRLDDLTKRAEGVYPADYVREVIDGRSEIGAHGTREMPVWGLRFERLYQTPEAPGAKTDAEARASAEMLITGLVDYIRTLQAE